MAWEKSPYASKMRKESSSHVRGYEKSKSSRIRPRKMPKRKATIRSIENAIEHHKKELRRLDETPKENRFGYWNWSRQYNLNQIKKLAEKLIDLQTPNNSELLKLAIKKSAPKEYWE